MKPHALFVCLFLFSALASPKQAAGQAASGQDVDAVIEILGDKVVYDWAERSFSPLYSNIGMVVTEKAGIPGVYIHYNYKSKALKKLIQIDAPLKETKSDLLGITQILESGYAKYAFYDHNSFIVEVEGVDTMKFNFNPSTSIPVVGLGEYKYNYTPWLEKVDGAYLFKGYMPNRDKRDPDPMYPVSIGVKVIEGKAIDNGYKGLDFKQDNGKITFAVSFQVADIDNEPLLRLLNNSPANADAARLRTKEWFAQSIGNLPLSNGSVEEKRIAAVAALALTFNACASPGQMKGRIASFPNRGNYATHYEWDACFQNLGYEMMEPGLAEDAMLILTETTRPDGKMGQFVTSTSLRPVEIQVPLVGWASRRLYDKRKDKAFLAEVLDPLLRNNKWILSNRMTQYGLTSALSPWELWDDTPRLDSGAILACDFNADLLMQIQACEYFARELGDQETAQKCKRQADQLAQRMVDVLYDEEANIFRDVLVETGEPLSIITPANFVPLLADLPIPEERAKAMIQTYLLDTTKMFGSVPFPSVAYDEPSYVPCLPDKPTHLTWRGPTWMPMAWMMLEVLKKYGFEEAYNHAANRIFELLVADGKLHELFNSQTGEGIGIPQLGWTAAIYLKLKDELDKAE